MNEDTSLAELLDAYFRFKPGDLVVKRTVAEYYKLRLKNLIAFPEQYKYSFSRASFDCEPWEVIERLVQQCPGGCQLHYRMRYPNRDGDLKISEVLEHEVSSWQDVMNTIEGFTKQLRKDYKDGQKKN